jgi:hypothetical protein
MLKKRWYIGLLLYFKIVKHGRACSPHVSAANWDNVVYCDSPEDGGRIFVRNIGELVPNCKASHHRVHISSLFISTLSFMNVTSSDQVNGAPLKSKPVRMQLDCFVLEPYVSR